MFTRKLPSVRRKISFSHEPCLINKMFKYKSLGEMVAMARATGVAPVPTRNGVYTGDQQIPRDTFEKINFQRAAMNSLDDAQQNLDKLLESQKIQEDERRSAEIAKKAVEDYKQSLPAGSSV